MQLTIKNEQLIAVGIGVAAFSLGLGTGRMLRFKQLEYSLEDIRALIQHEKNHEEMRVLAPEFPKDA
jgi:hypothetical protein